MPDKKLLNPAPTVDVGEPMATATGGQMATAKGGQMEIVVAVSDNDVIGRDNQLPWHLPADLRRFKALTMGKPVLMGRKTHESIGRPLPGRANWVLSRSLAIAPPGCQLATSLDNARHLIGSDATVMIIGGAEIYRLSVHLADRIHLTIVHTFIERGDAIFSAWRGPEWREIWRERHEPDERHASAYSFVTLERV